MTQREAIETALDKAQRFGSTRLVIYRPSLANGPYYTSPYYTIKASEKRLWTQDERCILVVPSA